MLSAVPNSKQKKKSFQEDVETYSETSLSSSGVIVRKRRLAIPLKVMEIPYNLVDFYSRLNMICTTSAVA
jgi:hypothetical protein